MIRKIDISTKYKYDQIDYISTMLNSIKTITDLRQDKYNTITIDQFKKKKKKKKTNTIIRINQYYGKNNDDKWQIHLLLVIEMDP